MKQFNNKKLIERWREKQHTDKEIAETIGVKAESLSRKIKNGSEFSATQAKLICELIEEPMDMFYTKR